MQMSVNRAVVVIVAAVGAAAVVGGITYASVGGGGVISACYKAQNGQVRLIDPDTQSCLPSEEAIQWNQTGPQGLQGPQGVQGEQGEVGPTGPRGPSNAYDGFRNPGNNISITGTSLFAATRVLQFNIPAGGFAITSKVNVSSNGSSGGLVHCYTKNVDGWFDMGIASIGSGPGQVLEATLSTTFTGQSASAGLLSIDCWRENFPAGAPPLATLAEAVAIQVAQITTFVI